MMKDKIDAAIKEYEELSEEASNLLVLARDTGLQSKMVTDLNRFTGTVENYKADAIQNKDEDAANFLLGMICALSAISSELQMYILLKSEKPEEAWDVLIDHQDAIAAALRAHEKFRFLEPMAERGRNLEKRFFPSQVFMSAGLIVHKQVCSICGVDYSECDHLAGFPYLGQFCSVQLSEIEPDHVAIVEEPANRKCRITSFTVPGGVRNRMTWVVTPKDDDTIDPDEFHAECIIATSPDQSELEKKRQ